MTFQVTRTANGSKKVLKNGVTLKAMTFDTHEDAQAFADSCFANARADWKNEGRKLPKYEVTEAA